MTGYFSPKSGKRAALAIGASLLALTAAQPALAQSICADGSAGPICTISNDGTQGPVTGTAGTVTIVQNSGNIAGTPAIAQGGSVLLNVTNAAGGVIDGNGGNAIQGTPALGYVISNAGTINGNVVFNDQPGTNVFTGALISYISDGGTLNGDLQLGTTGFSSAYVLMRGADSGVTGTISAGAGLDIYALSYDRTQAVELGQYALPTSFEIEGYEISGANTILTLTGAGSTINLAGNGNVVNEATIGVLNTAGLYPPQVEVVPAAIGYYQPRIATFRREQIPLGQPGSVHSVFHGNALDSFTNNGIVNGDIRLATARFTNSGAINLESQGPGTVIHGAADRDFLFSNSGTIMMTDTGARVGQSILEAEFEDGTSAAVRIRSALDTTAGANVRIENSGSIVGGLDAVVAARSFTFENSGSIAGIETAGYFSRGLSLNVGELDLVVGEDAQDEFNADNASILNDVTGSIEHGFSAVLAANVATVENRGSISASGQEGGIALYVEHDLLSDDEDEIPGVPSIAAASLSLINSGTIAGNVEVDGESSAISIVNSGDITRGPTAIDQSNFPQAIFGGSTAVQVYNETDGDHVLEFTNSGSIVSQERGGTALGIEVEAGDEDTDPGIAPLIGSARLRIVNSGTIAATGGATVTPAAVAPFLPQGSVLVNPIAALTVDATDVTGDAVITIENLAGGVISASGTLGVVTPNGYLDQGAGSNGASAVAIAASGKTITIINAGRIEGGAGSDYAQGAGVNAVFDDIDLPDHYLAGAIQTAGDNYDLGQGEVYVGSVDHVVNTATGEIVGSIDLGANDDIIENYGSITGNVFLRDGNDKFVQSLLATFDGVADGGAGEDMLAFDITGSNGIIDQALRDRFVNFELFSVIGTGALQSNDQVVVSEGGSLELSQGSNLDVGVGNTAIAGSDTVGETVVNKGTVTGDIDMRGGDNVVTNSGQINGNISFGDGSNSIANQGRIAGNVVSGQGNDSLANSGTITGTIDLGGGDDTLLLTGDWAVGGGVSGGAGRDTVRATLTGSDQQPQEMDLSGFRDVEQFDVNGGTGAVEGTASFENVNISGGRLIGRAGSTIMADVNVGSGGTFGSAGDVVGNVSVGSGGTLSPGASPAVMNVAGNVSLAGGSVTTFEFVPAPGQSDQLLIDGDLVIASGATLDLVGNRPLTPGSAYDMIVADSITGTFTIGSWDRTAVQGFLRYTPTRLQLLGTFVAPTGLSTQTGAAVDYVNGLLVSGGVSDALLGAIPSLLDGNGLASGTAFGRLTPEAYASASQLGVEQGLSLAKAARSGATASGRSDAGLYSFAQGLGSWRKLRGDAATGVSRASSHSYGVLGGLGYGSENGSLGAFIGYIDSRQNIAGLKARTDADGVVAGVSGHFATGGFDLDALVAYDWSDARTRRAVPGNVDVVSRYDLHGLVLDASAGYRLPVSAGWAVRPELGITHISTRRGAATESGSTAFALAVTHERTKATFIDGGLSLRGGQQAGATFQPWAQLGLRHQLEGENSAATAGFVGATSRFTVLGAGRRDTLVTAGAGFSADLTSALRLFAAYQGEFGSGHGNNVNVGIRLAF